MQGPNVRSPRLRVRMRFLGWVSKLGVWEAPARGRRCSRPATQQVFCVFYYIPNTFTLLIFLWRKCTLMYSTALQRDHHSMHQLPYRLKVSFLDFFLNNSAVLCSMSSFSNIILKKNNIAQYLTNEIGKDVEQVYIFIVLCISDGNSFLLEPGNV